VKKTFISNDRARSLRYLAKPLALRGFDTSCQTHSADRETGGVIQGAATFTPREWYAVAGDGANRRMADALVEAGLARWAGNDLVLDNYDADAERIYRDKRESGRLGGLSKGRAKRGADGAGEEEPERLHDLGPSGASTTPSSTPVRERRSEASRGMVGEGEARAPLSDPSRPRGSETRGLGSSEHRAQSKGDAVPDGSALVSIPMDLVTAFEEGHEKKYGAPYRATHAEIEKTRSLWARLTQDERGALPSEIWAYLDADFDATLGGFCEWELPRLRGAA
jgi:hypothetical protein